MGAKWSKQPIEHTHTASQPRAIHPSLSGNKYPPKVSLRNIISSSNTFDIHTMQYYTKISPRMFPNFAVLKRINQRRNADQRMKERKRYSTSHRLPKEFGVLWPPRGLAKKLKTFPSPA